MQEVKKILNINSPFSALGRIWGGICALWALVLFVATLLIAILFYMPCFFLKDPAKARWHRKVSRVWMLVYLNLIGCPLTVKGNEQFKKNTNYVVVCNHNSLMDVPVSTPFMPRATKTIAKKSFTRVGFCSQLHSVAPFYGTLVICINI